MDPGWSENTKRLRISWGVTIALFIIQFAPYVFRPDAYIRIHDTLEGEWMWYNAIVQAGNALSFDMDAMMPAWFGGIPRYLFPTGLSVTTVLVFLCGPVNGYFLSSFLIDLFGFLGCYLLFRKYVFTRPEDAHWPVLIGALFSILPLFATFGIAISGLPLLMLAFLDILRRDAGRWQYLYILVFPFYSNFVWSAPFVNLMLLSVLVMHRGRGQAWRPFVAMLAVMDVLYLAANYHLLYAIFGSDLVLQRESYAPLISHSRSLGKSLGETAYLFLANHYHIGTTVNLGILLLAACAWKDRNVRRLTALAFGIALLNGFYLWLVPALEQIHPMLISFRVTRVKMLLPFIWMGILAYSIKALACDRRGSFVSAFVVTTLIICTLFANDEIINNYRNWFGFSRKPDAHAFLDAGTWEKVGKHIGRDKSEYIVAHLGLNPAISQYNGFRTIDGLQAMYPLEHKEFMIEVMKGELEKDERLVRYFNAWGNRCYLFSAELGKEHNAFMIDRSMNVVVGHWEVDTELLGAHGVEYVFSSVVIGNSDDIGLELEGIFKGEGFWRVYLYRLS